jgi:hypothetical protein
LSGRPVPILVMQSLCSTFQFTQYKTKLCVNLLQSKKYSNYFQVFTKLLLAFLGVSTVKKKVHVATWFILIDCISNCNWQQHFATMEQNCL